ncbi:MAG: hypothetical protein V1494_05565 [Candidatus Diapherotrites archaeon]
MHKRQSDGKKTAQIIRFPAQKTAKAARIAVEKQIRPFGETIQHMQRKLPAKTKEIEAEEVSGLNEQMQKNTKQLIKKIWEFQILQMHGAAIQKALGLFRESRISVPKLKAQLDAIKKREKRLENAIGLLEDRTVKEMSDAQYTIFTKYIKIWGGVVLKK